jgi:hypothetical protein
MKTEYIFRQDRVLKVYVMAIIITITNQNRFLLWSDVFIFGTIYYLAQLYKQNNDSLPNVEDGGYPVCRSYHWP